MVPTHLEVNIAVLAMVDSDTADLFAYYTQRTKVTETGCWEWIGARDAYGYGIDGRKRVGTAKRVHRVAVAIFYDLDYNDRHWLALHDCDNPPCWNPAHLKSGDHSINMLDMSTRRPDLIIRGDRHHQAKVTNQQAGDIRQRFWTDNIGTIALAREYGITRGQILAILKNKSYRDASYTPPDSIPNKLWRLTQSQRGEIRNMYLAGASSKRLAGIFGVDPSRIRQIIKT